MRRAALKAVQTAKPVSKNQRTRELGHIHQGRRALGWSEDDYRYHLRQQTGEATAASLNDLGRAKMLAHMAKLGYIPMGGTFRPFNQAEKILWLMLPPYSRPHPIRNKAAGQPPLPVAA